MAEVGSTPTPVECRGDGGARGRAHGEEARELVHTALARWEAATGAATRKPIGRYVADFLGATDLVATTGRLLPDLAAEIEGIAEGAGVDPALVAAYNLMDEAWWYELRGCSVLAVADGERAFAAQNMDLPGFMDGTQLVLRVVAPDAPEALVLTSAGLIGLTGVNRAGLAVCVNTLLMLRSSPRGLPVAAIVRATLACDSLAGAAAFLRAAPHASGQHYAIATAEGVVGLECGAAGAVTSSRGPRLVHTNHPLAEVSTDPAALAAFEQAGAIPSSHARLRFLSAHIDAVDDLDAARRVLADTTVPVCVPPAGAHRIRTFGAVAFALGDPPAAGFCLDPQRGAWEAIGWTAEVRA